MARYDSDSAAAALEIERLILDWGWDLDAAGGTGVPGLCTEDVRYLVAGKEHTGRDAVGAFYAARNARVATQQRDGVRTQRHTISNMRIDLTGANTAEALFLIINYSAEGKAPALNLVGPTIIADTRMEVRREADGEWRIALFDSEPVFVGNDPFLNAAVVKA